MILTANWPAPANIQAFTTLKHGGFSLEPYSSNNLALHVGDNPDLVYRNRQQLIEQYQLPSEPIWLEQTHSTLCVDVENDNNRIADASVTRSPRDVLAIMTADCLPILLCDKQGNEIAAIHAGWRGLVNGIVENTLQKMHSSRADIMAWIGPGICGNCFEVGREVVDTFIQHYPFSEDYCFPHKEKWRIDFNAVAERILQESGINNVYQSENCTIEQEDRFFSYRRASQTGRMATLIWFNNKKQD